MKISAEYIWVDGTDKDKPTRTLRSKNRILKLPPNCDKPTEGTTFSQLSGSLDIEESNRLFQNQDWWNSFGSNAAYQGDTHWEMLNNTVIPDWGMDGSSTLQADTAPSDRPLIPVCAMINPLRSRSILVLCEVMEIDGTTPHESNTRRAMVEAAAKYDTDKPWFGIEQEYTLYRGGMMANVPYGWPERGQPDPQGKYYCGVGLDEVPGRHIAIEHEDACRDAGLLIGGTNPEVMPGQFEFQTATGDPVTVSDHLWLMRYLLFRIAANHKASVRLDPKPVGGDWNGAGGHTNMSTRAMRGEAAPLGGFQACEEACQKIGASFEANGFPDVYGHGYEKRLTGAHETCSYENFKYGVADRGASIRIPLHVKKNGAGYIEDRRPCANIDPYEVTTYLMNAVCR
jgi:glutamine synthetase